MFKPRNIQALPDDLQEAKDKVIAKFGEAEYEELCKELNALLESRGFGIPAYTLSGK